MPDIRPALNPRIEDSQVDDMGCLLQTWLFFGMLHEFFGSEALASLFIVPKTTSKPPVITTKNLNRLLDRWIAEKRGLAESSIRHLLTCIEVAYQFSIPVRRTTQVSPAVFYSIAALNETLYKLSGSRG